MNLLVFPTVRPAEAQNTNTSPKSVPTLLSPQMCAESHLNSINLMPSRPVTSLTAIYHASLFLFLWPIIFDSSQQLWHCGFISINEQALVWLMHHFTVKPNYATLSIHTALNGHTHTHTSVIHERCLLLSRAGCQRTHTCIQTHIHQTKTQIPWLCSWL